MTDQKTQTIRRARHTTDNPYAQIERKLLQNKKLSHEARGLIAYLLSKPGDWEVRISDLQCFGTGRDRAYKILGELMEKGYVKEAKRYQNEDGFWSWTPYEVHETPLSTDQITYKPKPKKVKKGKQPSPEIQDTEFQYTENADTESQDTYSKQNDKERMTEERDTNIEKREKIVRSARADDFPLQDDADTLLEDAAEYQSLPLTEKQNSTQGDNSAKRLAKTAKDTTLSPHSAPPSLISEPKPPTPFQWAVSQAWKSDGMGSLMSQLMGTAKAEGKRKAFKFEMPATALEIWLFPQWWKNLMNDTPLPSAAETLKERFDQFRGDPDYLSWMRDCPDQFERAYKKATHQEAPVPEGYVIVEEGKRPVTVFEAETTKKRVLMLSKNWFNDDYEDRDEDWITGDYVPTK